MKQDASKRIIGLNCAGLVNRPALHVLPLEISEDDIRRAGVALARRAEIYRNEQAALGRNLSISDAVMAVQAATR